MSQRAQKQGLMCVRTARMLVSAFTAMTLAYADASALAGPKRGTCLLVANVESWDFLYIREKPDHRSRKVGAIQPDSKKKLVVAGDCVPAGANKKKLWCMVNYNVINNVYISGYIKMYYTKETNC